VVKLKRVYEKPQKQDGFRVLVDRLWPRGLSKDEAKVDVWLKDISPSEGLRKRFGHDPKKWEYFRTQYRQELKKNPKELTELRNLVESKGTVTLLFAAKDEEHSNAAVLQDVLSQG
jgi:uncharacterized protein YeaO (DUF488 family)